MKKLNGYGSIGMLLALLIIGIIFAMMMPALKDSTGIGGVFSSSSVNNKSAEEEIYKKIENIEKQRQNSLKDFEKINQEY